MNQQITLKDSCDTCSKEIEVAIAQTIIHGELRWYKSYSCDHCGAVIEIDGIGFPPDEIRQKIIHGEGEWSIAFNKVNIGKASILKVLRQALDLSIAEANTALGSASSPSLTGTKTEMLWLKGFFDAAGIEISLYQANSGGINSSN
jgi:hypothetical protein